LNLLSRAFHSAAETAVAPDATLEKLKSIEESLIFLEKKPGQRPERPDVGSTGLDDIATVDKVRYTGRPSRVTNTHRQGRFQRSHYQRLHDLFQE